MTQNIEVWWSNLCQISKGTMILSSIMALSCNFDWVSPHSYIADWYSIQKHGQSWRLITSLFFLGKVDMSFLMSLFLFVEHQNRIGYDFRGNRGDHIFLNFVIGMGVLLGSYLMNVVLPSYSFILALVWVWSKMHAKERVSIYYFNIEAQYYPIFLAALNFISNGDCTQSLIGYAVGQIYYLLKFTLPRSHGIKILETPALFHSIANYRFVIRQTTRNDSLKKYTPSVFGSWFTKGRKLGSTLK